MEKKESNKTRTSNAKVNKNSKKAKTVKNVKTVNSIKKAKKRKKLFLILFMLVLIIVSIYLLLTLDFFNIKNINVVGLKKYTNEQLINAVGIKSDNNIFLQVLRHNKNNYTELPYIENVKVSLKFPNKIEMKVTERQSIYFAYDKERNKFYRLDKNGYILENIDINSKTKDEILTYGIPFDENVTLGTKINDISITNLAMYSNIHNKFNHYKINGTITKVNFENSLTTVTLDDKLNVVLPNDTNIDYNMTLLKSILENIPQDSVGVIDMTISKPVFSSF